MSSVRLFKHSFAGGEIAPEMFGRIEDEKYQSGLALCRNFVVKPQGAVENRAGLKLVRAAKYADRKVRLLPFTYSTTQTIVIEFGHEYCRFHTQGATLLDGSNQPYELTTPYQEAELFDVHYVQSADIVTLVHPNHPPMELKRYGAADWRLETIRFTPELDAPQGVAATAHGGGGVLFGYVVTAIAQDGTSESEASAEVEVVNDLYTSGHRNTIRWNPVNGASRYKVYKRHNGLYGYIGQTTTTSFDDDNISADMSVTPPLYDDVFISGGILSVPVLDGGRGYLEKSGIASAAVLSGGQNYPQDGTFRTRAPNPQGGSGDFFSIEDRSGSGAELDVVVQGGKIVRIDRIQAGRDYTAPRLVFRNESKVYQRGDQISGRTWQSAEVSMRLDGFPELVVSDATGSGAQLLPVVQNGRITAVRVLKKGSSYTAPSITVQAAVGNGALFGKVAVSGKSFPAAVSYFSQRRVFAGTHSQPQNIWMTKSGTESNMSYSIPTREDDRIAFRVAAREANTLRHTATLNKLILLTSSAEWRMETVNSEALTPSSVSVAPHSYIGASNVQPVVVNSTLIYCAARGGHVREMAYSWQAGGYVSGDLSLRSPHLFDGFDIADMTYSKAPIPVVWFVSSSGELLGNTYIPEQQIGAWHRHDTHKGRFESCTVVAEGAEDVLYCVVLRKLAGGTQRFIERLESRAFTRQEEAFFVDCGLSYSGAAVNEIQGLEHLEGETVAILADGAVLPETLVHDGKIRLPIKAKTVHVGLPIVSDMQTLPVAAQIDSAFGQGRKKNVNKVLLRVWRSSGIWVGPTADKLTEAKQRRDEPYGQPPALRSGDIEVVIQPAWDDGGQVFVRQTQPLPLTVVGATAEVVLGG